MPSDFTRIRDNVQKMVDQTAPAEDIDGYLNQEGFTPSEFKIANDNYGTFVSAIKRGGKSTGSLIADFLPMMGADLLEKIAPESWKPNLEAYKQKQFGEAQKTQEEIAKKLPAQYESYQDVTGPLSALGYAKEAVGESIPSMLPGIVTGGIGSILGQGAVRAAGEAAAAEAAEGYLASQAAKNVSAGLAQKRAAEEGVKAAAQAMTKKGLQVEAAGALTGSAALNMPDAYQSLYDPNNQNTLLPALASGAFNSVLDAITPFNTLRLMKKEGISPTAVVGAWYKQGAKELGKGLLTEGSTEALQEMSNAKAEQFVKGNPDFFTPENLTRFVDAGLKGGLGGGALQGGIGALTARNVPEAPKVTPTQAAPTTAPAPTLTPSAPQGQQGELFGAAPEGNLPAGAQPVFKPGEVNQTITPEGMLTQTGKIQGYTAPEALPPQAELTGVQQSLLPEAAQGELPVTTPNAPEVRTSELKNVYGQPIETLRNVEGEPAAPIAGPAKPISTEIQDVVKAAKEDPAASKILKGNNAASATVVSDRIQSVMPTPDADPIQAMEQVYAQDKTGTYPAGVKPLSDAQNELLQTTYRRLTGKDIEAAINDRALLASQQNELFPEGGANVQGQGESPAGTAGTDVGVPGGGLGGTTGGTEGPGAGGVGVGGGEPRVAGNLGGEGAQPTTLTTVAPTPTATPAPALTPEQAWDTHKEENHPAFSALNPDEQQAWTRLTEAGRNNAINFQDIVSDYLNRQPGNAEVDAEANREILQKYDTSLRENIKDKIQGKTFNQILSVLTTEGPEANQTLMRKVADRVKDMQKIGYVFKVKLVPNLGARGSMNPFTPGAIEIKLNTSENPNSIGTTYRTASHEIIHAVTYSLIDYGKSHPSTPEGRITKELNDLQKYVVKYLKDKRKTDPASLTEFERDALDGTTGNPFGTRRGGRLMHEIDEMITWGLTDGRMLSTLDTIPYKNKTAGSKFLDLIRKLLGITPKQGTAFNELFRLSNELFEQSASKLGIMEKAPGTEAGIPLTESVSPSVQTIISSPPAALTQTQAAETVQNKIDKGRELVGAARNSWDNYQKWDGSGFRVKYIDKISGLSKTLSQLPIFQNGQLRADMLLRSFNQVINLVQNGMRSGLPVVNADGTVGIKQDAVNNLGHAQHIADNLDANPYVRSSGKSGRQFIAEIARALRGEEIRNQDEQIRANAEKMLAIARSKMTEARILSKAGASPTDIAKLVNEARAIRSKFQDQVNINREKQVTDEHIAWAKAALQAVPEAQQVLDIWRNINEGLIDLGERTGFLTPAKAAEYRANVSYVPLYISEVDLSPDQQEAYGGKATGTKTVREINKLEGTDKYNRNIWENMGKHYAMMTTAAFQNQTRKVAAHQLMSAGIEAARYARHDDRDVNLRFRDSTNPFADKNGIVSVVLDNPNDLAAFQMMSYELGPIMKGFTAMTDVLRTTALVNPMYWVKQLIRDPLHANMVAGTGAITPFHALRDYLQILTHNSEEAKILASRGVIGPVDSIMDVKKFLAQVGSEKSPEGIPGKLWDKIRHAHEASDAATRVSIYKKAYADAIAKGMDKDDAVNYAVFKSRESINFSTRGNAPIINALRHSIPFFSASINSLDTVYRAAIGYGLNPEEKKAAQQLFAKRAAMMTVLSLAYAMMLQDDEDYKNLPDDTKDNNWLLPNPAGSGHSFIKVPVPFEIGFLFKTLPEVSVRYMSGTSTGGEALGAYARGLAHNLPGNGILIPQLVRPGLEAVTNFDFYNLHTIESVGDQNLPVELRGRNATELAKNLSPMLPSALGFSPAKIDHIIQGYMAEWGTFGSGLASSAINAATGKQPAAQNLEQMEGLRAFMTNPNASKAVADYYDLTHTAQETVNEFNRYKKEGMAEEAKGMMEDEDKKRLIAAAPALRRIQEQMAKVRSTINALRENQKMDPDARRDEINRLQGIVDRMAKQGLSLAGQLNLR